MATEEITATLENWRIHPQVQVIIGEINGDVHNRWLDGTSILTSPIDGLSEMKLKEGTIVETMNSVYKLGKPWVEEDYEEG